MKWNVQLPGNDLSSYEFLSDDGKYMSCKYNRESGSLRLKGAEHYGVIRIDGQQLINRKFFLANVYGSVVGHVTRNLWKKIQAKSLSINPDKKLFIASIPILLS